MFASWPRNCGRESCWGAFGGKREVGLMVLSSPREEMVSTTEAGVMNPVEFESRTENASRIEWRSCGGNLERLSVCDDGGLGEMD